MTVAERLPVETVREAAARLSDAARTGVACAPIRDVIDASDVESAYAVQQLLTRDRVKGGARIIGRKIGLTSPAVQAQLGVDQPDFGVLFDDMLYRSGDTVAFGAVLQPRVEAEVAFVLGQDLGDGVLEIERIRDAVDYAVAAIEVCGSRVADWDISLADTVADNASAGVFVLGAERRGLEDIEPRTVAMTMTVTDQHDSTGTGEACLGDPLVALQWLARQAHALGDPLRAGQIVLSGALGPMRPVGPGALVDARITGLGDVSVRFSEEPHA